MRPGPPLTDAEAQFHKSSIYQLPDGYTAWVIRNDYPAPFSPADRGGGIMPEIPGADPNPWLEVDFKTQPIKYIELLKEYFMEGQIESDFTPQKNHARQWYHSAWMHYGDSGREPIRGLTNEGFTPPYNLASGQSDYIASWANAFFNAKAASVLGGIWKDPNNPRTNESLDFPEGSVLVKMLFTDATDEQLPSMKGSPEWKAAISPKAQDPQPRNDYASCVRVIQMDIMAKDCRAPLGWVFGGFWYNGLNLKDDCGPDEPVRDKWNRLMPIGVQWGNDPQVTQAVYEAGGPKAELHESWVSPAATKLLATLGGKRPFLGWNGRMNGPADTFISACMSCHSVGQVHVPTPPQEPIPVPPPPVEGPPGKWTPKDDKVTMEWFRNIKSNDPFTKGAVSTDFCMQARSSVKNYYLWKEASGATLSEEEKAVLGRPITGAPRTGPEIVFL